MFASSPDGPPHAWVPGAPTCRAAHFAAEAAGRVVGLAGTGVLTLVERDEPVGRLTALVVGEEVRVMVGRSSPTSEACARAVGCVQLDLSSSDRREEAHALYRRLGFAEVSRRFLEDLMPDEASGRRARR